MSLVLAGGGSVTPLPKLEPPKNDKNKRIGPRRFGGTGGDWGNPNPKQVTSLGEGGGGGGTGTRFFFNA